MIIKLDYFKIAPKGMKIMFEMENYLGKDTTLEPLLQELIKIRVSQINGCAFCLNYHTADSIKMGETSQRIFLLNTWDETNLFTAKEKVAIDFAEKITLIADYSMDESAYDQLKVHFTDKEIVDLMLVITQINSWNRINITFNTHLK